MQSIYERMMKKKLLYPLLLAAFCVLTMTGCSKTLKLADYVDYKLKGYDGFGVLTDRYDTDALVEEIAKAAGFSEKKSNYDDKLEQIEDDLSDVTGDMSISYSSGRFLEFNRKGVDKGAALKILADRLGVPMSETMALGDNYNDLTMIKAAGLGVAVANSVPEVKEAAGYVSDKTNDEDAAADAIERFVFS